VLGAITKHKPALKMSLSVH